MKTTLAFALVVFGLTAAAPAHAWHGSVLWWDSPSGKNPGGGGIFGTGGQGDYTMDCKSCHLETKSLIGATITAVPDWGILGTARTYKPAQRYTMTVKMTGEYLGFSACGGATHSNSFAATFEDAGGKSAGVLQGDVTPAPTGCPPTAPDPKTTAGTTAVYKDCRVVVPRDSDALTQWTFTWTAPAAGAGTVTLFGGVGDGDCKMDSMGDDIKVIKQILTEGSALAPRPPVRSGVAVFAFAGVAALPRMVRRHRRRTAPA